MSSKSVEVECGVCLVCGSDVNSSRSGGGGGETSQSDYRQSKSQLSSQLQIHFILNQVLEVPQKQIVKNLQTNHTKADWIKICSDCWNSYVKKCLRLHGELMETQRKLKEASRQLTNAIKQSFNRNANRKRRENSNDLTERTRTFVKTRNYKWVKRNPVLAGDKEAEKLISCWDGVDTSGKTASSVFRTTSAEELNEYESWAFPTEDSFQDDFEETDVKLDFPRYQGRTEEDAVTSELATLEGDIDWRTETRERKLPKSKTKSTRKTIVMSSIDDHANVSADPAPSEDSQLEGCRRPKRKLQPVETNFPKISKYLSSSSSDESEEEGCKDTEFKAPETPVQVVAKTMCDMCRQRIPKPEIHQHINDHLGDYMLNCPNPKCRYVCCSVIHFREHGRSTKRKSSCGSFYTSTMDRVCDVCGYQGCTVRGLHTHIEQVHERQVPKCLPCPVSGCTEQFACKQNVYLHITLQHVKHRGLTSEMFQTCPDCVKPFPTAEIVRHLFVVHDVAKDSIISSNYCPYKFPNRLLLLDHLLLHFQNGLKVTCDLCSDGESFPKLMALRRHYMNQHQIGYNLLFEHCSKTFLSKEALLSHVKSSHGPNSGVEKRLKCDECPEAYERRYYTPWDVATHKIKCHDAEPFKCSVCQLPFSSWGTLKAHEAIHRGVQPKRFPCDIPGCGVVCKSPMELKRHKSSVKHSGKTNAFMCEDGGIGFNTKPVWQNLLSNVHSSEERRRFVCEECGKRFISNGELERHYKVHSGELPYECPLCQKRCRQEAHLKAHMKVHQGVVQFKACENEEA